MPARSRAPARVQTARGRTDRQGLEGSYGPYKGSYTVELEILMRKQMFAPNPVRHHVICRFYITEMSISYHLRDP